MCLAEAYKGQRCFGRVNAEYLSHGLFVEEGEPYAAQAQGMGSKMHILGGGSTGVLIPNPALFLEHVDTGFLWVTYNNDNDRGRLHKVYLVASQPLFSKAHFRHLSASEKIFFFTSSFVITINSHG